MVLVIYLASFNICHLRDKMKQLLVIMVVVHGIMNC